MNPSDQQFISFQDYDLAAAASPTAAAGSAHVNVDLGTPNNQQRVLGDLQLGEPAGQGLPGPSNENTPRSFWTIEYYQKFFNVNTDDVTQRLTRSMLPYLPDNYLLTCIRPNPDLYGPFWVCATLIFSIAISGNLANYLQNEHKGYRWKYDFHVVTSAATCIYLYAWLLPLLLWLALKWSRSQDRVNEEELIESNASIGLLEILCLYGYSLTIYVPVAFLWTIPIYVLQWSLLIGATVLSGGVLLRSLLPMIPGKQKVIYIAVILGLHLALAAGFMLYFFHVASAVPDIAAITTASTAAVSVSSA